MLSLFDQSDQSVSALTKVFMDYIHAGQFGLLSDLQKKRNPWSEELVPWIVAFSGVKLIRLNISAWLCQAITTKLYIFVELTI